jgi:hypothetical protein
MMFAVQLFLVLNPGASPVESVDHRIMLRIGDFDPRAGEPEIAAPLRANDDQTVFIVQFVSPPTDEFRGALAEWGARILHHLPNHSYIVDMAQASRSNVDNLPFVRWTGPYHPAYRIDPPIAEALLQGVAGVAPARYYIQVWESGPRLKTAVAERIRGLNGEVNAAFPESRLMEATLSGEQLMQVIHWNEVAFIDRWYESMPLMDIARQIGGGVYVETIAGFRGAGVRAEVLDTNLDANHPDFQTIPPIFHGAHGGSTFHGTETYGINFGRGTLSAQGRGMVPDAQGIFASFESLGNRYMHISQLPQPPYNAVYQSNSWTSGVATQYDSVTALMDDIAFDFDFVIMQAHGNFGSINSARESWAKNVVSVGGVLHMNTLTRADDQWGGQASIGPAADGRIKPDLTHFYENIFTTQTGSSYTSGFGGTSGATPITAGHFGLFFEMWSEGIFGNRVTGGSVFESRPHLSTAKAMMINAASPYPFAGINHDLTRTHQGWGLADVRRLYDRRARMFIVDETDVLGPFQSTSHSVVVLPDEAELRITLVYTDPAGMPAASRHRVNDLTLKVTSPLQTVYYGNNGLLGGNWSTPGGGPNLIDTVENVFVQNPAPGMWTVEVRADEINLDAHVETPAFDADYALVVSGAAAPTVAGDCDADGDVELADYHGVPGCVTGPGGGPIDLSCACTDTDDDGDVDLGDLAGLQNEFACLIPVLISAPTSGPVCPTELVVLSAHAQGNAPLQYQWLFNGEPIVGANSPIYQINSFAASDAGSYAVRITNNCGTTLGEPAELSTCVVVFADDFETDQGWTVINDPAMTRGQWRRQTPLLTMDGTITVQPGMGHPADAGTQCFATGPFGGSANSNDVDGGPTQLFSPMLDLTGHEELRLRYAYWYYRDDAESDDGLKVSISADGGASWLPMHTHESGASEWRTQIIDLDARIVPTGAVQLRFEIADTGDDTTLKALVDRVEISTAD